MSVYYLWSYLIAGAIAFLLLLAYSPRLLAWFGAFKKSQPLHNDKQNRIAVLVPARNESESIEPLLTSLARQTYSNAEVFVIVASESDPTIALASSRGFSLVVETHQHCKSDALDAAVQQILHQDPDEFDAYLILDADTGIKEDYLEKMNDAMASGKDIIVSKKIVKNYSMGKGSLTFQGACNGVIWTTFDAMGNRFKSDHHIALFTVGSGLLLSKKVMRANGGWGYKSTLTEDCELAGDMIANHWSSFYADFAPIWMEEAPTLAMTNKRRNRWMSGLTSAQKLYEAKDRALGSFWDVYFSYSIFICYAYFAFLTIYGLGNLASSVILMLFNLPDAAAALFAFLGSAGLIYLSFFLMALVAFFASLHDVQGHLLFRIAAIFLTPFHYLGYFPIMLRIFFGKAPSSWEEIARVKEKGAH